MEGKDNIKDLFKEKLTNYQANVRPELWANISSQIGGAAGSVATAGLSVFSKVLIGISITASVGVVGFLVLNNDKEIEKAITPKTESFDNSKETQTLNNERIAQPISNKTDGLPKIIREDLMNELPESNYPESNFEEFVIVSPFINPVIIETPLKEKKDIVTPRINNVEVPNVISDPLPKTIEPDPVLVVQNSNNEALGELPNTFSPNSDGDNEFLFVKSKGLTDFSVVILDQYSKIVYQSNQSDFIWDGIGMNGEKVLKGNYVYYITARDSSGKLISKHNSLFIQTER